ncbi:MAG TPA: hypothetical protein VKD90_12940 [Gemmataceae bacterium]|nr:hypothetical protein [Gemmataceae bacterium]
MNKSSHLVIVSAAVLFMVGGAGAAWMLRDRPAHDAKPDPKRVEYDAFVAGLGGDEPAVRDELNWLVSTASARLDAADRLKVHGLTRECLDPLTLLAIGHVQRFVGSAARGEASAFHFVDAEHRARLAALAGEHPSPDRVFAVRRALARLATEFGMIRQPPDWHREVMGEPPPMPFLDFLEDGSRFLPTSRHPELRPDPRVPAFAAPDAELLAHLELYFNGARARAALPADRFPRLYVNGRIPSIPRTLVEYTKEIAAGIDVEKLILVPGENPDPEAVEAVNETFGLLDRFFTAIVQFDK